MPRNPLLPWLLIFALAAVSPLFINVALIELVGLTTRPMAHAMLRIFTEHDSFMGVMRVLNGLFLGTLIAVAFGVPLEFLLGRQPLVRSIAFVVGVLVASVVLHLSHKRFGGVAGFIQQWSWPEMWLYMLAACIVAAFLSKALSRRAVHRVTP
jgi:hypothetical protein